MSEKVQIHNYSDQEETLIKILEGQLPEQDGSKSISLSGIITAPGDWNAGQAVKSEEAHVIFNKAAREIILMDLPNRRHSITVRGELIDNVILDEIGLNNSGMKHRPQELGDLLRRHRNLAADNQAIMKVIASLKTFKFKYESQGKAEKDNSGRLLAQFQQKIESDLNRFFSLNTEIFYGEDKVIIPVEIVVEADGHGVWLWLEAIDLLEMTEKILDSIFSRERLRFEELTKIDK